MKAFRCSECKKLYDIGEHCMCTVGVDPRPNHRIKGDSMICRKGFKQIEKEERWHEKFSWKKEGE